MSLSGETMACVAQNISSYPDPRRINGCAGSKIRHTASKERDWVWKKKACDASSNSPAADEDGNCTAATTARKKEIPSHFSNDGIEIADPAAENAALMAKCDVLMARLRRSMRNIDESSKNLIRAEKRQNYRIERQRLRIDREIRKREKREMDRKMERARVRKMEMDLEMATKRAVEMEMELEMQKKRVWELEMEMGRKKATKMDMELKRKRKRKRERAMDMERKMDKEKKTVRKKQRLMAKNSGLTRRMRRMKVALASARAVEEERMRALEVGRTRGLEMEEQRIEKLSEMRMEEEEEDEEEEEKGAENYFACTFICDFLAGIPMPEQYWHPGRIDRVVTAVLNQCCGGECDLSGETLTIDIRGRYVCDATEILMSYLCRSWAHNAIKYLDLIVGCKVHGLGKGILEKTVVGVLNRGNIKWTFKNNHAIISVELPTMGMTISARDMTG